MTITRASSNPRENDLEFKLKNLDSNILSMLIPANNLASTSGIEASWTRPVWTVWRR